MDLPSKIKFNLVATSNESIFFRCLVVYVFLEISQMLMGWTVIQRTWVQVQLPKSQASFFILFPLINCLSKLCCLESCEYCSLFKLQTLSMLLNAWKCLKWINQVDSLTSWQRIRQLDLPIFEPILAECFERLCVSLILSSKSK